MKSIEQQMRDKMSDHEFPLQGSDWEAMQERLDGSAPSKRKPFGLFFKHKKLIIMSLITLMMALFYWIGLPSKFAQSTEKQTVTSVVLQDTLAPKNLLHQPSDKAKQRNSVKYKTKKINELASVNNNPSEATTEINQPTTVHPFRGRGTGTLDTKTPDFQAKLNAYHQQVQGEKAYLHLDRTLFKPDEDVWFSMYLRDANTLLPSQNSQILYVDLLAPNGNVQESKTYLVFDGQAAGDFHLPATLKGGIYKLRAYTNWMKNTNDAFERDITLQAVVLPNLSMKLEFERKAYSSNDEVVAKFDANTLDNKPLRNFDIDFKVSLAGNNLLDGKAKTDEKGRALVKFKLPDSLKTNDALLNITLPYNGQTEAISRAVPIVLNKIDFQMLPEGGEILANFENKIAFKALNEFGKPADIQGVVKDSKGQIVANFKSFHDGMGAFELWAKADEKYTAYITKPENIKQTFPIDNIQSNGAMLQTTLKKDKIALTIATYDDAFSTAFVVLQMNGKVLFSEAIAPNFNVKNVLEIPTLDCPIGVASVTLFDKNSQPRNERLVFLNRDKALNISIKTNKSQYAPREKVAMTINVKDDKGKPVKGNFSLAVADDAQLTFADDKQGHILSALLLESELKGKIEEPNFYFDTKEEKSLAALDYLLLTQGWRKFEWGKVMEEKEMVSNYKFGNEKASIKGYVVDAVSRNRIGKLEITLLPDNRTIYSNENGEYEFKNVDLTIVKQIVYLDKIINVYEYRNDLILDIHGKQHNYTFFDSGFNNQNQASLQGKVIEAKTGDDAINAYVRLFRNGVPITTVATDFEGNYSANIDAGIYDVEISYLGMATQLVRGVRLNTGRLTTLNVKLETNEQVLDAVVIREYKVPLVQQDNTTSGYTVTSEQIKNMPTRNVSALVGLASGVTINRDGDVVIKGARQEGTVYIVDGIRVQGNGALPPAQDIDQVDVLEGIGTQAQFADLEADNKKKKAGFGDLFKNKPGAGGSGKGSGSSGKPGNGGDPNSNNLNGNGGSGAGTGGGSASNVGTDVGGHISNRGKLGSFPVSKNYNENGDVVVSVCLNADGTVNPNSIKVVNKGTNTTSIALRNLATTNAKSYRFNKGEDNQCGTITYHFRIKDFPNSANEQIQYGNLVSNVGGKTYATARTFYAPKYDSKEVNIVRNDFRSTIFFNPTISTDEKGEVTIEFYNSDAVTTFRATLEGIGATGTVGRNEFRYATMMPMSLSAKAPDKVLTGDVVKIPLALKNNTNEAMQGTLSVQVPTNFEAIGEIPLQIALAANEAKTIFLSYKVKNQSANILGESQLFKIKYEANGLKDEFTTAIKTLSRGFPVTQIFSSNKLKTDIALSLNSPVESTATLVLTAYPSALDDVLQGMERMLQQPSGCFEQVSSTNYPNLLVLDLLRNTQQVKPEVEKRAKDFLQDGYKRLTAYECKSGGFDWWGRDLAHEGLTAYGILEFTDMARVFDVDKAMINRSVKWLLSRRNGNGGWTLNPQASHGWKNDDILDAYICYALAEAGYGNEIAKEIEQIYAQNSNKNDAYTQALLANTFFAIGDKKRANALINKLLQSQAENGSFTGTTHSVFHAYGNAFTIETTALVALALLKSPTPTLPEGEGVERSLAKAITFIAQSKNEYGYGNTQSTVMALKALCGFAARQKTENSDGKIIVMADGKKVAERAYAKNQLGKVQIADLEQFMTNEKTNIQIVFEGTDKAIPFDVKLNYSSKLPQNGVGSPLKFNTILAQKEANIGDVVRLSANLENITNQAVASPIMLIGIPAGLTAQPWQLKQIVERKECAFYEIFNNYIVFYFDELQAKSLKTINLDLRSDIGGSYESPASAAYPYYTNEWRVWSKGEGIVVK